MLFGGIRMATISCAGVQPIPLFHPLRHATWQSLCRRSCQSGPLLWPAKTIFGARTASQSSINQPTIMIQQVSELSSFIIMRSLYQRAAASAQLKCTPNLDRVAVDLDDELDLQCRNCLGVLVSLASVDYFMRLCNNEERQSSCFLVLSRKDYNSLATAEEMVLFEEEPFESIYLKEVTCASCNHSVGTYFETANCEGTTWLLGRITLNMDEVALLSAERNLLQPLRAELLKLIPFSSHHFERVKESFIAEEKMVGLLLKTAVDPSYPQNRLKHSIVQQFMSVLEEQDKNMAMLQKRGCVVAESAEKYLYLYMKLFPQLKKQAREKDLIKRN